MHGSSHLHRTVQCRLAKVFTFFHFQHTSTPNSSSIISTTNTNKVPSTAIRTISKVDKLWEVKYEHGFKCSSGTRPEHSVICSSFIPLPPSLGHIHNSRLTCPWPFSSKQEPGLFVIFVTLWLGKWAIQRFCISLAQWLCILEGRHLLHVQWMCVCVLLCIVYGSLQSSCIFHSH